MPSYIGLYYPFIHFRSDDWVKLAALYWDNIGRIVPHDYETRDSGTVEALSNEDVQFIKNFPPEDYLTHEVGRKFVTLLEQHQETLRSRYGVDRREDENWPVDPITSTDAPAGSDTRLAYVFGEKIWGELEYALHDSQLVVTGRGSGGRFDDRWLGMHPHLASVYMSALADEMAAFHGLYPTTGNMRHHLAVAGWTVERLAQALLEDVQIRDGEQTEDEVAEMMANVAFSSVIPKDIKNVPIDKIISVREQYSAEQGAFQSHLHKLVSEMETRVLQTKDPHSLKLHLENEYKDKLAPELDELKGRLNSVGIDTVKGLMNVQTTMPTLLAAGASAFAVPAAASTIAGAAVVAFRAFSVYRDKRTQSREELRTSPAAYLFRIEEALQPDSFGNRLASVTRRFLR